MKKAFLFIGMAALAVSACSETETTSEMSESIAGPTADAAPEAVSANDAANEVAPSDERPAIPAAMPQLAYDYGMDFELEPGSIGKLMRRHANICEQQGAASCRIVGMELTGRAQDDDVRGTLTLAVAANHARAVTALLEDEAADAGAELASSTIGSDGVSKQVVDTEARIRAREQLRDRLLEVLRTRKGSVQELVEAERSVAAVNEEIDQARSWLAETKGRVAFSKLEIDYAPPSGAASEFTAPIEGAMGSLGGILGGLVAALIVLLAIALPVGGAIAGLVWLRRRLATASA